MQWNQSGSPAAAVSRLNGAVTLKTTLETDWPELKDFLNRIGYESLTLESKAEKSAGEVMEFSGLPVRVKPTGEFCFSPSLFKVYDLLKSCEGKGFHVPSWEPFYVDVSHRLRHKTARVCAVQENGKIAACAFSFWETPEAAVIAGVAAAPQMRRQGLGSAAVLGLIQERPDKRYFVFRVSEKNERFYHSLGFVHSTYFGEGF